jgi:hypothetical protein
MVLLLAAGGLHPIAVGAQIATPDVSDFDLDTTGESGSFTFTMADGTELATITVQEVFDPFEDAAEGFVPGEGSVPVMVQVQVENSGEAAFDVRPDQFLVQDADGYLWRSSPIPRAPEEIVVPDMQYVTLAPGDRVTGMLGYQIPAGGQVAAVLLSPESSRLLTVARVSDPNTEAAELDTEIAYANPETGAEGEITITSIEDPFEDFAEGRDPEPDTRYVLLEVAIENTGSTGLEVSPGSFVIHDTDGYLWQSSTLSREPDAAVPNLQSQQLGPGSRITGVVGFVVPEEIEIAAIVYQPDGNRLITLYEAGT